MVKRRHSQKQIHAKVGMVTAGTLLLAAISCAPLWAVSASHAGQASRFYTLGLNEFKKGDYPRTVFYMKRVTQQQPQNALAHYYLASSLVHLKRHKEAIAAYQRSYQLDPYGIVSGFCRRALLAYHAPIPDGDAQRETRETAVERDATADAEKSAPSVDPLIGQTHKKMKQQLEEEKARRKAYSDSMSANVLKTAEDKGRKIKEQAEEEIRELYAGPWLGRVRGMPYELLTPTQQAAVRQRADEIRREANEKAEMEKHIALERTGHYKQWFSDRQQELEKAADDLETQLHGLPGRSGISLSPVGTGLYVRNYTTFSPKNPLPDAHGSFVRLTDQNSAETHNDPKVGSFTVPQGQDQAGGKSAENGSAWRKREVTGKVLN